MFDVISKKFPDNGIPEFFSLKRYNRTHFKNTGAFSFCFCTAYSNGFSSIFFAAICTHPSQISCG